MGRQFSWSSRVYALVIPNGAPSAPEESLWTSALIGNADWVELSRGLPLTGKMTRCIQRYHFVVATATKQRQKRQKIPDLVSRAGVECFRRERQHPKRTVVEPVFNSCDR